MADEQPNTPSAEPQAVDASASEPSSVEPESKDSSPHWWQRMFLRRGDADPAESSPDSAAESASSTLTLTQDELDRRIQAETDRREAKRAQTQNVERRRQLRDSDPWAYAEEERKAEKQNEGNQALQDFLGNIGVEHDKISIDPLFLALPKAEQERIRKIDGAGTGLVGRKLVVDEALQALEKHWRAEGAKDAEQRLRRNQAFRKQLLAEARGQTVEPDLLPPISASESDRTVSALLRKHYHMG